MKHQFIIISTIAMVVVPLRVFIYLLDLGYYSQVIMASFALFSIFFITIYYDRKYPPLHVWVLSFIFALLIPYCLYFFFCFIFSLNMNADSILSFHMEVMGVAPVVGAALHSGLLYETMLQGIPSSNNPPVLPNNHILASDATPGNLGSQPDNLEVARRTSRPNIFNPSTDHFPGREVDGINTSSFAAFADSVEEKYINRRDRRPRMTLGQLGIIQGTKAFNMAIEVFPYDFDCPMNRRSINLQGLYGPRPQNCIMISEDHTSYRPGKSVVETIRNYKGKGV